ncbi:MAG: hypothetical protein ACRELD_06740 [Longimicrobiales bacterium]
MRKTALGPSLDVTPGVRYRSYTADFDLFGSDAEGDITYLVVDVGLGYRC